MDGTGSEQLGRLSVPVSRGDERAAVHVEEHVAVPVCRGNAVGVEQWLWTHGDEAGACWRSKNAFRYPAHGGSAAVVNDGVELAW